MDPQIDENVKTSANPDQDVVKSKHLVVSNVEIKNADQIPDNGLRDPNFMGRLEKIVSFEGAGAVAKIRAGDMLYYMLEPGTDLELSEEAADKLVYPFEVKEKPIDWNDVVSVGGVPRSEIFGPNSQSWNRNRQVWPNAYWPVKESRRGKVLEIQQINPSTRHFILDMNGDGKLTLNFTDDMKLADESDKILEVNRFWPSHQDMYNTLHVGSEIDIDRINWLIGGLYAEIESRIVRTPESGVKSYDGKEYDSGGIFDYLTGRPTKEAYEAAQAEMRASNVRASETAGRSIVGADESDIDVEKLIIRKKSLVGAPPAAYLSNLAKGKGR
ncbi:MAG: hypothetical protein LBB08_02955 [Rickettsiales bacterium]|jgi:hypothetical protein|nr:hypothetical protein [Rickettsiales bacterium]